MGHYLPKVGEKIRVDDLARQLRERTASDGLSTSEAHRIAVKIDELDREDGTISVLPNPSFDRYQQIQKIVLFELSHSRGVQKTFETTDRITDQLASLFNDSRKTGEWSQVKPDAFVDKLRETAKDYGFPLTYSEALQITYAIAGEEKNNPDKLITYQYYSDSILRTQIVALIRTKLPLMPAETVGHIAAVALDTTTHFVVPQHQQPFPTSPNQQEQNVADSFKDSFNNYSTNIPFLVAGTVVSGIPNEISLSPLDSLRILCTETFPDLIKIVRRHDKALAKELSEIQQALNRIYILAQQKPDVYGIIFEENDRLAPSLRELYLKTFRAWAEMLETRRPPKGSVSWNLLLKRGRIPMAEILEEIRGALPEFKRSVLADIEQATATAKEMERQLAEIMRPATQQPTWLTKGLEQARQVAQKLGPYGKWILVGVAATGAAVGTFYYLSSSESIKNCP